jgi:hypothetical protein
LTDAIAMKKAKCGPCGQLLDQLAPRIKPIIVRSMNSMRRASQNHRTHAR